MKINRNNWMSWVIRCNLAMTNNKAFDKPDYWDKEKIHKGELPKNLCAFFWTFVLALVIQIINWPALIAAMFSKEVREDPAGSSNPLGDPRFNLIVQFLGLLVGVNPFHILFGIEPSIGWLIPMILFGVIVITVIGGAAVGVLYLIHSGYQMIKMKFTKEEIYKHQFVTEEEYLAEVKRREEEEEERKKNSPFYVIGQWIKAKKSKVCPIIEYDE